MTLVFETEMLHLPLNVKTLSINQIVKSTSKILLITLLHLISAVQVSLHKQHCIETNYISQNNQR